MRVISIDVGIKNLAYCILEQNNDIYNVIQWDVINLCGEAPLCNCSLKPKVKKGKNKNKNKNSKTIEDNSNKNELITICNKKATYRKVIDNNTLYYCQVHAKQSDYLLPDNSVKKFKSWKRDVLISYAASQSIALPINVTITKDILIKHIGDYLDNKLLERISSVSANEMTLIQMGVKLVAEFDRVLGHRVLGHKVLGHINDMLLLDHIIIENQISPIANRMKTLQGMIAQYFIMRDKPTISFISSANKLKMFAKEKTVDVSENKDTDKNKNKNKNSYDERKKEGVRIVKELLEENKIIGINWLEHFSTHKKKDDLADSFLQGAWFLNNLLSAKQVGKG